MNVILRQRLDRKQRLECLGTLPVLHELVRVQPCPLAYEAQVAVKKAIESQLTKLLE